MISQNELLNITATEAIENYANQQQEPMTPNIEQTARSIAQSLWQYNHLPIINTDVWSIIVSHLTTHTQSLETKLAYAEDALAKNDLARQNAGGMEMRIKELEEEIKRLREALDRAMQMVIGEFGSDNWRTDHIKAALTKPT